MKRSLRRPVGSLSDSAGAGALELVELGCYGLSGVVAARAHADDVLGFGRLCRGSASCSARIPIEKWRGPEEGAPDEPRHWDRDPP